MSILQNTNILARFGTDTQYLSTSLFDKREHFKERKKIIHPTQIPSPSSKILAEVSFLAHIQQSSLQLSTLTDNAVFLISRMADIFSSLNRHVFFFKKNVIMATEGLLLPVCKFGI